MSRPCPLRFDPHAFDLRRAHTYIMSVYLLEHETAGPAIETWPHPVMVHMRKGFADWHKRYPAAAVICVTTAVEPIEGGGRHCVMTIHHRARGG